MPLFAQRWSDGANKWLAERPMVVGAGALVLGLILVGLGVSALLTGRARTKYGGQVEGGQAMVLAIVWLVFGIACVAFGLFKMVGGGR